VELPDEVVEDLRKRLRRAGGQVQAVETMLAEGRECREVVIQLSAATKALEQVGFRLIASGLTYCIEHPDEAAESGIPRGGATTVHQVGVNSEAQQQRREGVLIMGFSRFMASNTDGRCGSSPVWR